MLGGGGLVLGQETADVFDLRGGGRDGDADVAGAGQLLAGGVTVFVVGHVAVVGRHRQLLVDDPVLLLLAIEMVMALEEDADLMLHHQLVDRKLPAGSLLLEGAFTLLALAAPFVEIGFVDPAATGAEDVVGEDELMLRLARLERVLEPLVLGVADGDAPPVAVLLLGALLFLAALAAEAAVDERRRVPVVVEQDEERVTPGPGAVTLQRADLLERLGVAAVDPLVAGNRVEGVARLLHPDRDVVAFVLLQEVVERPLLVVAVHQEDLADRAHQAEERTLEQVRDLAVGVIDRADALDRKIIADADMEVGVIGGGRAERAGVEFRMAGLGALRMGVALEREDEGRAGGALGGEAGLRTLGVIAPARLAVIQTIEVFRVRGKSLDDDLRGLARGKLGHRRLAAVTALRRADLEERFHRRSRKQAGRDGLVGRATEDQGELGIFRERLRQHVITLEDRAAGLGRIVAPALAAFAALPFLLLRGGGREDRPAERRGQQADELTAHHLAEGRLVERIGFSGGVVFGAHGVRLRRWNAAGNEKLLELRDYIFRKNEALMEG